MTGGEGFLPSRSITSRGHCGSSEEGRAVRMLLPGVHGKICYRLDGSAAKRRTRDLLRNVLNSPSP